GGPADGGIPAPPPRANAAQRGLRRTGGSATLSRLPRSGAGEAQAGGPGADRSAMGRVGNVVLLNEHPVEQALLRHFLSSEGVASSRLSPRASLDALAALAPDLVIADAPGAHGCARLRQRLPGARIVAIAGADEVEGAHAVLRRPLDFHRLNRDLRPLLDGESA